MPCKLLFFLGRVSPQSQHHPLQFVVQKLGCFYIANPQFITIDAVEQTALRTQIPLLLHVLVLSRSTEDDFITNAH